LSCVWQFSCAAPGSVFRLNSIEVEPQAGTGDRTVRHLGSRGAVGNPRVAAAIADKPHLRGDRGASHSLWPAEYHG
jgi:hypothetical protein